MAQQNMEALATANEFRLRRAQLGRELASGEVRLSELLGGPEIPDWLHGEPVDRLLLRAPGIAPRHMREVLADAQISQKRRVGELTPRQRRLLSDYVSVTERKTKEPQSA